MNDDNDYAANHPVTGESYDPRLQPRFTEIPTFMRAPFARDLTGVDIGLIGVPRDLGVTNRAGARHGPREIRNASSFMRAFNLELGINPFELCTVRDLGDVHFRNWFNLDDQVEDIAAFFTTVQAAGVRPLSAGGDHSITYPILKGINTGESLGLVHIDAHTDTWAEIWGSKFHHGAPFSACSRGWTDRSEANYPALEQQVRNTEIAFAQTMADRDFVAFKKFVSRDTVFLSGKSPSRGRDQVEDLWKAYYQEEKARFHGVRKL